MVILLYIYIYFALHTYSNLSEILNYSGVLLVLEIFIMTALYLNLFLAYYFYSIFSNILQKSFPYI